MNSSPPLPDVYLDNVTFRYPRRSRAAVRETSWKVPQGRTLLLGPNGAGKSTLLQILAGVLTPQSGHLLVAENLRVGYMPQHIRPVPNMSVVEQIAYVGWLQGLSNRVAKDQAREVVNRVQLTDFTDAKTTSLSGGQLRRVGVAQALVAQSDVLLLDEPTAGLDPAQRVNLAHIITSLNMPTVVSTHQVEDIETSYDDVVVMAEGQLVFTGDVAEFLAYDENGSKNPVRAYTAIITARGLSA